MVKRLTKLEYEEKIKNLYNDEYELIGEFKTTQDKIIIHHKTCGNKFPVVANEFTRKRVQDRFKLKGCPGCIIKIRPLESVLEELQVLSQGKLSLISGYLDTHSKVLLHCNECDYEWNNIDVHTLFGNLKTKTTDVHGCPRCSNKLKKNTSIFKEEVYNLVKDEYSVTGEYIGTNIVIDIIHNDCGTIYPVRPVDFLYKENRCPICAKKQTESRAISYIREILDTNEINHMTEKRFKSLCNFNSDVNRSYQLPFDIFIRDYKIILEYDGAQHFNCNSSGYFTHTHLINIAKNDYKKNKWTKELGTEYIFIRLHYKLNYNDIYEILNELLATDTLSKKTIQGYGLLFKPINSDIIINEVNYYTQMNKSYFNIQ